MSTNILERDVVIVSGPDTFSFLQSLVSQDVDGLADGRSCVAPADAEGQGRLVVPVVRGDDAWLDCEAGFGDALRTARAIPAAGEGGDRVPRSPGGWWRSRRDAVEVPASCRAAGDLVERRAST
jgi:hypothetical protein